MGNQRKRVRFLAKARSFVFSTAFREALRITGPSIQYVLGVK
jgi:hypothetical protein